LPREDELLAKVPEDGSPIGNISLMSALGWQTDEYWSVRNMLIERGVLVTGKGKGGSVRKSIKTEEKNDQQPSVDDVATQVIDEYKKETALYEPLAKVISESWAKSSLYDNLVIQ